MLGKFNKPSWEMDDDDDYGGSSGGDGGGGGGMGDDVKLWKFRFKMPDAANNPLQKDKPVTHRIMILNEAPFQFWEHGLYSFRRNTDHYTMPCIAKNRIDKRGCPVCDKEGGNDWPSCIGLFTIIDFGQVIYGPKGSIELHHRTWTNKKNEEIEDAFPRKILAAKKGSKKSPGVLKHLLYQAERRGNSLEGTVWDVSRSGEKEAGIGETWEYVDRVAPEDYVKYLEKFGADTEGLNVDAIEDWAAFLQGDEERGYSNKIVTYEQAQRIVGLVGKDEGGGGQGGGRRSDGAGYNDGPPPGFTDGPPADQYQDDDIPF